MAPGCLCVQGTYMSVACVNTPEGAVHCLEPAAQVAAAAAAMQP